MYLTERHAMMRDTARAFADREIRPQAARLDEAEEFSHTLYRKMAAAGFFGIAIPEAEGGVGADTLAFAVVMEEVSRGYASLADELGNVEMVGGLLAKFGTPAQKARYLALLLADECISAFALTEAEAGSDLAGLKTTATRDGTGWILDGEKLWIHNAPNCNFAVVLARTDKDGRPSRHERSSSSSCTGRRASSAAGRSTRWGSAPRQVGPLAFEAVRLGPEAIARAPRAGASTR